ncbi:CHRD domain-containing protein [Hyalangium versicolor]|uniref:CHRD domain-containing protein n=1 Tax=Hyalangium versicolor TaxID=2861190 RepID=UPI001CD00089|nr:CHRD domain-containing protein [Hyalangium versicolor]
MRMPAALTFVLALSSLPAHAKDPALGATTFTVYEAYMSPSQQPGEETEVPKLLEKSLGSTAPSTLRENRKSRGWGQLRFAKDLSKAYVDVEIQGVNAEDIIMFHIHCGPPGVLGPIIVDFGESESPSKKLANGKMSLEITNKNIVFIKDMKGLKPMLPESCPAELGFPTQSKTIASLEYLARKGVLYFNLHTKAHTYYGEMRGQIYPAQE